MRGVILPHTRPLSRNCIGSHQIRSISLQVCASSQTSYFRRSSSQTMLIYLSARCATSARAQTLMTRARARAYRFQPVSWLSRPIYRGVFLLCAVAEKTLRFTNRVFPSHVLPRTARLAIFPIAFIVRVFAESQLHSPLYSRPV